MKKNVMKKIFILVLVFSMSNAFADADAKRKNKCKNNDKYYKANVKTKGGLVIVEMQLPALVGHVTTM